MAFLFDDVVRRGDGVVFFRGVVVVLNKLAVGITVGIMDRGFLLGVVLLVNGGADFFFGVAGFLFIGQTLFVVVVVVVMSVTDKAVAVTASTAHCSDEFVDMVTDDVTDDASCWNAKVHD